MDVLEKNMIITTTEPLLNYGSLDKDMYTMIGEVSSELPFTLTIVADGVVIPYVPSITEGSIYTLSFNVMETANQFLIDTALKFQLRFDTIHEKKVNLKLWKPYPISPVLPN